MPASPSSAIFNLVGFLTGSSLYAMLFFMAWRKPPALFGGRMGKPDENQVQDYLPLMTACLGLAWNLGSLTVHAMRDFELGHPPAWLVAGTFTALGFLPAVVVHSALAADEEWNWPGTKGIHWAAYGLSCGAGFLQVEADLLGQPLPAPAALQVLTFGFGILMVALYAVTWRETGRRRVVRAVTLAVFAVSALHLTKSDQDQETWWMVLEGHHASIPLAFAILYEDYRFALADIFLKRALTLVVLVGMVAAFSGLLIFPLWGTPGRSGPPTLLEICVMWGCWMATSMAYPAIQRGCSWFVDRVVLHRPDYARVISAVAEMTDSQTDPNRLFQKLAETLTQALTAQTVIWIDSSQFSSDSNQPLTSNWFQLRQGDLGSGNLKEHKPRFVLSGTATNVLLPGLARKHGIDSNSGLPSSDVQALVLIPTAEAPNFLLLVGGLAGGRRMLSDDVAMLEAVAVLAARRIDALRVNHERYQQEMRTQELSKLATEAELQTLRAQINPHFLFNALTTIGFLIQTAPQRALDTLFRLTSLLRGVLRNGGEFSTLGEELDLIESYLMIERARFEERLRVTIEVPAELRHLRVPALLIQPLVENAVKHGIAPHQNGGEVMLSAHLQSSVSTDSPGPQARLWVTVRDTGIGSPGTSLTSPPKRGFGLANVERRLMGYFGSEAVLEFESNPGAGTRVALGIPVTAVECGREFSTAKGKTA
ncbi:MAG: histidine kinase [Blastocatellia bacterium]|nr:histidine kinase [Blastocatellia bacterium]